MANTSAICNSFKQEVLVATHNFTASTGNTFKLALFDSDATLGAGTTAYATSEEITGTGYTAGGKTITSVTPVLDSQQQCVILEMFLGRLQHLLLMHV